jgi:sulfide dehydrogenase cytochrome subunit
MAMKMFRFQLLSLAIACCGGYGYAADLDALTEMCDGCHGAGGVSEWSDMPTIAGIDAFTHSEALYVYRDNARLCRDSEYRRGDTSRAATNMCDVVSDMSDDDIETIAEHYASLPFVPAMQKFDAALATDGEQLHLQHCNLCHSAGGSDPEDEAGILAGQWFGYLESTFAEYRSGDRDQPGWMKLKMDELSDDDVTALLHYYASQQ